MRVAAGMLIVLITAQPAAAQNNANERPAAFKKLVDCRTITDPAERLACFDREVAGLEAAESRQEVIIVDRAQAKKTQRSLFGLSLNIFGAGEDETKEITSTIKRAWPHDYSKWTFELAEGGHWEQTDGQLAIDPRPGDPVQIRRNALGSYFANVNKQSAIRVRRVR